jgi:type IV pilus assembly protein PilA
VKNKSQKGFTLIELLVVIAIIGILSSVVLASLNSARQKGQITAIKSNLKNIIPQAELLYDVPGNYSTVCADSKIISILTTITNAGNSASCVSYNNSGLSDVNLRWGGM